MGDAIECPGHPEVVIGACVIDRCAHVRGRALVQYRYPPSGGWAIKLDGVDGTVGFPSASPDPAWEYWLWRLTDGQLGSARPPATWPDQDVEVFDARATMG